MWFGKRAAPQALLWQPARMTAASPHPVLFERHLEGIIRQAAEPG
ncbi:hypothetical protein FM113_09005 [Leucobacter sp. 7(1)]|uniref:Uncharacterized protein n=1 Tax=Microbacterium esteraromaticum TaxID=57043 RepID=A0A1R4JWW5_9MICO|nr:hypothetical protein FM113_09005 [Leucobacter sp. 7(1)]SJN36462.1 hypothetical protein FM104_09245 [Microbacterium esteraromaticum]